MNIGLEIEFTGIKRESAALSLADVWNTKPIEELVKTYSGSVYKKYKVVDLIGNTWTIVRDRSIKPACSGDHVPLDYEEYMCELVSPVLKYDSADDMTMLKNALNAITSIGGFVNETCGVHLHIDCPEYGDDVYSLFMNVVSKQNQFISEFGVPYNRLGRYCQLYTDNFISGFSKWHDSCKKEKGYFSISDIQEYLYKQLGEGVDRDNPRNPARYYIFNMDSIHKLSTLEFRWFNSTLSILVINLYISYIKDLLVESGYLSREGEYL